jgi:hypothetical protein
VLILANASLLMLTLASALKLVLTLDSTFKTSADTRQCLFSNADACQRLKLVLTPIVP